MVSVVYTVVLIIGLVTFHVQGHPYYQEQMIKTNSVINDLCAGNDRENVPHPDDCGAYITCYVGSQLMRLYICAVDSIYDPEKEDGTGGCVNDVSNSNCYRGLPLSPEKREDLELMEEAEEACTLRQSEYENTYLYHIPGPNSSVLYMCSKDLTTDGDIVINARYHICQTGYTHNITEITLRVYHPCWHTLSTQLEIPNGNFIKETSGVCKAGTTVERHHTNCLRYYVCVNRPDYPNVLWKDLYECPSGFGFNKESIEDESAPRCVRGLCPSDTFNCCDVNIQQHALFQNPYDCKEYYECAYDADLGIWDAVKFTCPDDMWFEMCQQNCTYTPGDVCPNE